MKSLELLILFIAASRCLPTTPGDDNKLCDFASKGNTEILGKSAVLIRHTNDVRMSYLDVFCEQNNQFNSPR
jgi:hypothetical protein